MTTPRPFDRRAFIASMAAVALLGPARAAAGGVPPADRELRVPVEGGSIYVRVNGDLAAARAPLLMLHGGPGGALWQLFPALPLADERAVILYDQLDSGRSDAPGNPALWTVDRFASEIDAIRSALGLARLHLFGHSWGGIVAHRYAAGRPKGLLSLVLQGTPLSAARFKAGIDELVRALPRDDAAAIEAGERSGSFDDPAFQRATMAFVRRHLDRTPVRDVALPYMQDLPVDRGDAVAATLTGLRLTGGFLGRLADLDDEPLARRVAVPTLLLRGEHDIIPPDAMRAMARLFPDATTGQVPGAGHMAQFDQPDAWRAALRRFIARHDG